ncbi:MAG: rRNA maturation RNase YbeY [Gemmatimonadaceae bacterium]
MSVAVDVAREGVRIALSESRVREIAVAVCRREKVNEALISIAFVTNARIARMNREFLNHSGATDVITFELAEHDNEQKRPAIIGDIYIAPEVVRRNARANGESVRTELTRVVVHGVLHVLGFTHAEGDTRTSGAMWRRQEALVAALA